MRLGSKMISSVCLNIASCIISRHSFCGIDGNKLITSRVIKTASTGIVRFSNSLISSVEFFKKSGKAHARG